MVVNASQELLQVPSTEGLEGLEAWVVLSIEDDLIGLLVKLCNLALETDLACFDPRGHCAIFMFPASPASITRD